MASMQLKGLENGSIFQTKDEKEKKIFKRSLEKMHSDM